MHNVNSYPTKYIEISAKYDHAIIEINNHLFVEVQEFVHTKKKNDIVTDLHKLDGGTSLQIEESKRRY